MFLKIKKYISENTGILIRLDDIAENMNWDLMEKSELLFEKYQIKPILGVIPNNQDNDLLTYPNLTMSRSKYEKLDHFLTSFLIHTNVN